MNTSSLLTPPAMAERLGADNPALRALVNEASQGGTPLMLLHVDIDHFASVNENMSEAVGDMALALIAQRLRDYLGNRFVDMYSTVKRSPAAA